MLLATRTTNLQSAGRCFSMAFFFSTVDMSSPEDLIAGAGRPVRGYLRSRPSGAHRTKLAKALVQKSLSNHALRADGKYRPLVKIHRHQGNSVLQISAVWTHGSRLFFCFYSRGFPDIHFSASPDYQGSFMDRLPNGLDPQGHFDSPRSCSLTCVRTRTSQMLEDSEIAAQWSSLRSRYTGLASY